MSLPQPVDEAPAAGSSPTVESAVRPAPDPAWLASGRPKRAATDAERRALASVLRLRILRMCLYEPLTNREIAERVGLNPATVLHHVRTLADQGFLVAQETRRGRRGSREIPYRATGKSWGLDLGELHRAPLVETFIAEVQEVPAGDVDASRLGLRLSTEHEAELRTRLAAVLEEFAARPQDPDGKRLSLFLAIHPEP